MPKGSLSLSTPYPAQFLLFLHSVRVKFHIRWSESSAQCTACAIQSLPLICFCDFWKHLCHTPRQIPPQHFNWIATLRCGIKHHWNTENDFNGYYYYFVHTPQLEHSPFIPDICSFKKPLDPSTSQHHCDVIKYAIAINNRKWLQWLLKWPKHFA